MPSAWTLAAVLAALTLAAAAAAQNANYARPFATRAQPALAALPPGAVEPRGWLRDWCLAARDGYTGHMDDYDIAFRQAWSPEHRPTGEGLFWYNGAWPIEGGGYWFDGMTRLGHALHDEALIAQAKRRLEPVMANANSEGILFLWWLKQSSAEDRRAAIAALDGWPLWACGLLARAMAGHYAASGDPRALAALVKAYASDPDALRWIPGNLSNVWPAVDTWTWTGNPGVAAALDAMFRDEGGALAPNLRRYSRAPDLTPGAAVENAHVVEFVECTTPWAAAYLWTGDRRYLDAAVGWHDLLDRVSMQPHGVPVSDEWYVPTGAFRGSETCDVANYVWSQAALLAVTGEGRMGDRLERAFFNAGPVTVSRDFKTHVYFQSPNRFAASSPNFPHGPMASGGNYRPTHQPLCCTAALNRVAPWYVTSMWMATPDNGLAATAYGPCKLTALAADRVPVTIDCRTDYPFNETVEMRISPERAAEFPLELRVPAWRRRPSLQLNGRPAKLAVGPRGFARVLRTWQPGDVLRLRFPMKPSLQLGRDKAPGPPYDGAHRPTRVAVPAPGSTEGAPYATVSYGPLLFALPIPDGPDSNTPDAAAAWRYALDTSRPGLEVARGPMPSRWDWPLTAPLTLKASARRIAWEPDPAAPTLPPVAQAPAGPRETITLVPYGCTRFRISMFPVVSQPETPLRSVRRALFLGNSITLHGPSEEVGWSGSWGMAASAPEKDYVHLVANAVGRRAGAAPRVMARNIADFERGYATYDVDAELKEALDFDADLVVLAIGENVPPLAGAEDASRFQAAVVRLLQAVTARRRPLVVVRSCFWADPARDGALRQACAAVSGVWVDAGALGADPANAARSEREHKHDGVAGHPGDRGMKALADAIMAAVLAREGS